MRENNKALDKTIVYEYNEIGNIVSKKTYNYTTGAVGTANSEETFAYDGVKKDLLVLRNGSALTYDENGCLKTAPSMAQGTSGTVVYTWTKGKLTKVSNPYSIYISNTYDYTYDANGRRTNKKHTSVALGGAMISQTTEDTTYLYDLNGRLVREGTVSSYGVGATSITEKVYLYNDSGVIGMIYTANGTSSTYYFDKNAKGDIVGIYDASGNMVAKYAYDAYGKCTIVSMTNTIANANPFRYRGYYYDAETGMYWLSSRYYSPELCRFISPDSIEYLDLECINGLNLYSYANNNPIGIVYSSYGVGGTTSGGMINSVTLSGITNGNYFGSLNSSGENSFLGNLISGASSLHGGIDKISSYLAGSVDGLLTYMNNPRYKGFHNKLNSYSNWLMGIGIGLDIASSAYNNYMNPNLTLGQKRASFGLDVGYIAVTSGLSYIAGDLLTKGAVALGALVGGVPGGIIVVVGIVVGTVLIAVISDALDNWWEKKKEEWFN